MPQAQMPPSSWQGYSVARWILAGAGAAAAPGQAPAEDNGQRHFGALVVNTSDLLPGLLRKNGIPYGAATRMREFWDFRQLSGHVWITVGVQVFDPEFLQTPYTYDSIFQRETDGSKWVPEPCSLGS
jgi:hypothetical protein